MSKPRDILLPAGLLADRPDPDLVVSGTLYPATDTGITYRRKENVTWENWDETAGDLADHLANTTDAHDASAISSVAAGNISSTNVQFALNELDTEKAPVARSLTAGSGLVGGGDLSADRTFSVNVDDSTIEVNSDTLRVKDGGITTAKLSFDVATQAELDAHVTDSSAAHAASAISADSTTLVGTGTDVQAVLEELDNGIADHLADTTDAHAGTAITNTPAGNIAATTVQAAINELDGEKQPLDSDLTAIAGLTPTNDDFVQRKAGAWTNRTMAQLIADLAALGTTFQPLDSDLTAVAALSTTSFGRGLLTLADQAALLAAAGAAAASHNHSGADITSGTVDEAFIDADIARDSEVAAGYQPLDSDLTSIAALTTTSFGRGILTYASGYILRDDTREPNVTTADDSIAASTAVLICETYEIGDGFETDIGAGSRLEIT